MRAKADFPEPVVISGAGHAMNVQKPIEYNEAVLGFLDGRYGERDDLPDRANLQHPYPAHPGKNISLPALLKSPA
jgi:hypothetical protein